MSTAFGDRGIPSAQEAFEDYDGSMLELGIGSSGFRPLDDIEIRGIVSGEITDAVGSISAGSEVAESRRQALRLFFGKPFGNEVAGRSRVVMTEVSDTIHWIMPSLMRIFLGGDMTVEFEATSEKEEEHARQATKVINQYFREDADGFMLLYEFFFTALLERRAYVKIWQEERIEPEIRSYKGLTEAEYENMMQNDPGLELVAYEERTEVFEGQSLQVFDCTVRRINVRSELKLRGIPPEEFMIARRELKLDDSTWFAGERRRLYSSDLIAMGYPPEFVEDLPTDDSQEYSLARTERLRGDFEYPAHSSTRTDLASRQHWINECYIRIDADGDGFAELRKIVVIGDSAQVMLENEYVNFIPYASLTAYPVPFKFHGQSVSDLIGDIQRIKSTLWRQVLDNTYLQSNQRHLVLRGAVELQDMMQSRPGGMIRVNTLDAVKSLDVQPLSPLVISLMDKLDETKETRTGASPNHPGIDAASLKGGATGVSAHLAAAQSQIELIARIFAEGGVKDVFRLMLRTLKQGGLGKRLSMKLGQQWVDVDPTQWDDNMKVKIKLGLGVGAATERISYLMAMINLQQQALQQGAGFLTTPYKVYRTLGELTKTMGFPREDIFFEEPERDQQWPEPPPDTKLLESQRRSQEDQMKNAVDELKTKGEIVNQENMNKWRLEELDRKDVLAAKQNETSIKVAEIQAAAARANVGGADSTDTG